MRIRYPNAVDCFIALDAHILGDDFCRDTEAFRLFQYYLKRWQDKVQEVLVENPPYRVFQYSDPSVASDDGESDTRWIAAASQELADQEAQRRKWNPCGAEVILKNEFRADPKSLKQVGVDVVLEIEETP